VKIVVAGHENVSAVFDVTPKRQDIAFGVSPILVQGIYGKAPGLRIVFPHKFNVREQHIVDIFLQRVACVRHDAMVKKADIPVCQRRKMLQAFEAKRFQLRLKFGEILGVSTGPLPFRCPNRGNRDCDSILSM
jgi:hypothetical protein